MLCAPIIAPSPITAVAAMLAVASILTPAPMTALGWIPGLASGKGFSMADTLAKVRIRIIRDDARQSGCIRIGFAKR